MSELSNNIDDINIQEAEVERLVDQGVCTYGEATRRVYGDIPIEPIEPIIQLQPTEESTMLSRKPKQPVRVNLGWRGRLMADEPPEHIRRQLR